MQIFALSAQDRIPILRYLACKFIQALLCLLGAQICLRLFSVDLTPTNSVGAFSFSFDPPIFLHTLLLIFLLLSPLYKKGAVKTAPESKKGR
jgi:hypothetical protein